MSLRDLYSDARVANAGVSVDDAVAFFVHSLKDPLNPLSCCPSVMAAYIVIQPDETDRSLQDIDALDRRWGQCRCTTVGNTVETRLHILSHSLLSWGKDTSGLKLLIHFLVELFGITVPSVNVVRIAKGLNSSMWPVSPRDLIPYSPKGSVKSIVILAKFMGDATVLLLLSFLIRICRSLLIPAVVSSHLLSNYIVDQGLRICANVDHAHRTPAEPVNDAVAEQFCSYMISIVSFFSVLAECLPRQIRQFYANRMVDYFEFLSQAVNIIESPLLPLAYKHKVEVSCKCLTKNAAILYELFRGEMTVPRERINPTIGHAMDTVLEEIRNPAIIVWELINHARKTHICYASGCAESLQTSGRMYQRCSGCLVVGYSSKECQRRAWKDPHCPHRDICKTLRRVVDAGKGHLDRREDSKEFVGDMERANIADSVLHDIIRWLYNMRSMLALSTADGRPIPGVKLYDPHGRGT